jgi:hypothetical protein
VEDGMEGWEMRPLIRKGAEDMNTVYDTAG